VPAFALTSPWAGSDAASIPDSGVVCKGMWQGKEVIGMRVNWDKRYITLAPVCTVFGLAFHLYDPDGSARRQEACRHHLCAGSLRSSGRRYRPSPFPAQRHVHERPDARQGCLHAARFHHRRSEDGGWRLAHADGVPGGGPLDFAAVLQCRHGADDGTRTVGGYARVRSQFKMAVGKFEGVEEALTRIGAYTYMMDATRTMTAGAVDLGEKPSVVSAIAKYHVTERARQVVNDGMDVVGGKGICLGPSNFLGRAYQQVPMAITVEGANILTRSLIIFGQGAIRCHPYLLPEMQAAQNKDVRQGLVDFDKALWGHIGYTIKNGFRALWLGMTGSHFVGVNVDVAPEVGRYYQQMTRFSAAFAFLSDISLLVLGGSVKRREKLSARLGDILAQMYLISCTLKRFEADGRQAADLPLVNWAIWDAMYKAQEAFDGVIANFPNALHRRLPAPQYLPVGSSRMSCRPTIWGTKLPSC
jgi:acyl-CoA dehydrogenase